MDWQATLTAAITDAIGSTLDVMSTTDRPDYLTVMRALDDAKIDAAEAYVSAVEGAIMTLGGSSIRTAHYHQMWGATARVHLDEGDNAVTVDVFADTKVEAIRALLDAVIWRTNEAHQEAAE